MNPQEELRELIAQAKEHLRYYSELGLTLIGEAPAPAAPEPKPHAPPIIPPPQFIQKPTITMPIKQENAATGSLFSEQSLFGETAAESAGTQYADETLEDIRRDLGDCQRCKLFSTRTNIVFGEGAPRAELMFVGEGPGADEDATGRPFVG
ncbi:MAG TPA: uracil-DNA glycosylase family protein, partial [Blastocatellia bacterium]